MIAKTSIISSTTYVFSQASNMTEDDIVSSLQLLLLTTLNGFI